MHWEAPSLSSNQEGEFPAAVRAEVAASVGKVEANGESGAPHLQCGRGNTFMVE